MFQHVKGVVIASVIAIAATFLLSLLMPTQLIIEEDVIINQSEEDVYNYIKEPMNLMNWFGGLQGVKAEDKGNGRLLFQGGDNELYFLEVKVANKARGIEVDYFKGEEKRGVFVIKCSERESQTVVYQTQYWNIGWNPISKLIAHKTKDKSEEALSDEMFNLKQILEK